MVVTAMKPKIMALDGAKAVAEAMRQMNPDVVAAYPITPQTEIVQTFSQFVADGIVDTEFVPVESEHAAMSACVGAAAAGGRVQTATTSAGMALMWEMLYIAASLRLPIVMHFVNRALSAPLNIHCDHSDSMGARDAGWIHLFAENAQEAYDNAIQSVRIAEAARLPVLHTQDGFIISHGVERVEILPDEAVRQFIGEYKPERTLLDTQNPASFGILDLQDYYFEHKRQQVEAMDKAPAIILEVGKAYGQLTGRRYGFFDAYKLDDADIAVLVLGSTAGTAKGVVDDLRAQGVKAGLLKLRLFRPFPVNEITAALKGKKAVAVLDRSISFGGQGGPVFIETCAALFNANACPDTLQNRKCIGVGPSPKVVDYIYGLGGRDVTPDQIRQAFDDLRQIAETGQIKSLIGYLGLRD